MAIQIPNVLYIKEFDVRHTLSNILEEPTVVIRKSSLPNINKNKLYYIIFRDYEISWIFHIVSYEYKDNEMTLKLGNCFRVKQVPNIEDTEVQYIPLSEFGLQQLEPGYLIEIKK